MIRKVLIANRGEIALRVIKACKELSIKTVAVYTKADKESKHVQAADEQVCIGEATSSKSYLDIGNIIGAALNTKADAVHPGYGFLAENSTFARALQENKLIFIGPTPENIDLMGNKSAARETAKKAGVPITPGSAVIKSEEDALKIAAKIGYPVLIKASAGGGGKGIRLVDEEKHLLSQLKMASNEASSAFGNPDLYIEKYLVEPHHIEVQILGDSQGNVVHLGERDCSIQRRHQKLIEESPSPAIDQNIRQKIGEDAVALAKHIGYVGAGTVEFLFDKDKNYYFMEMNTRVQVEHPVSEMVTGIDIVANQILIANGETLPFSQEHIEIKGHSIECRINAEDPFNQFTPSPGKITRLDLPSGFGVRVDTHLYNGYSIPPFYDSLLAKLIVYAADRERAISKMKWALEEFKIEGVKSTIPFHLQVLDNKDFNKGRFSTHFLENFQLLQPSIS